MTSLLLASLAWSLSFGLIADRLAGFDAAGLAAVRLVLAAAVFAPWARRLASGARLRYALLGAVQFGVMYLLYLAAYASLPGHAVALFTVTTPVYVVLVQGIAARRLRARDAAASVAAVAGAAWIKWATLPGDDAWTGVLLVQGANLCFALGQVVYARWRSAAGRDAGLGGGDAPAMAWMYAGAAVLAAVGAVAWGRVEVAAYPAGAWAALLYLGVVPTGAAFWLWNRGVVRVSPGFAATMNNLKVPLAVVLAALLFGEAVDWARLLPGAVVVLSAAASVAGRRSGKSD